MVNPSKIRNLENHILNDHPDFAGFHITNQQEITLHNKAQQIRQKLQPELLKVVDDPQLTFDQQQTELEKIYNTLNSQEKIILSKDSNFMNQRLFNLILEYFTPLFPENSHQELCLHICWFLSEMQNLALKELIIDSEWKHNRNEDSPNFDDFRWWAEIDKKMLKTFSDGVFTEKSLHKLREWLDNKTSEYIREYWKQHPEEYNELIEKLGHKS